MSRRKSRRRSVPQKKRNYAEILIQGMSNGAKNLIHEILKSGIKIPLLKLGRSGSKGNIIKKDVEAWHSAYSPDEEE